MGCFPNNALMIVGIYKQYTEAVYSLSFNVDQFVQEVRDPGSGNGGLGRRAACFMNALATLSHIAWESRYLLLVWRDQPAFC